MFCSQSADAMQEPERCAGDVGANEHLLPKWHCRYTRPINADIFKSNILKSYMMIIYKDEAEESRKDRQARCGNVAWSEFGAARCSFY